MKTVKRYRQFETCESDLGSATWEDMKQGSAKPRRPVGPATDVGVCLPRNEPRRSLPEVCFHSEADLVGALVDQFRVAFPATDRAEWEVPSRLGIADVVIARTDPVRFRRRAESGLAPVLLPGAAQLLAVMSARGADDEQLFVSAGLQRSYGRRLMRSLAASGHVRFQTDGWSRALGLIDPYEALIAIEAKLGDWKRGLSQAMRYSYYADFTYVALPCAKAARVDISAFESFGIGLVSVGQCTEIAVAAPASRRVEPWRRLYVAEVLMSRALSRQIPHATRGTTGSRYPRAGSPAALGAAPAF